MIHEEKVEQNDHNNGDNPGLVIVARLMLWMFVNTFGYTRELTPEQIAERWKLFHR